MTPLDILQHKTTRLDWAQRAQTSAKASSLNQKCMQWLPYNKSTVTCLKSYDQSPEAKVKTGKIIGEDQFRFVKGSDGTREAIGSLKLLAEKCMEHGKQFLVCFVDYEKAVRPYGQFWWQH